MASLSAGVPSTTVPGTTVPSTTIPSTTVPSTTDVAGAGVPSTGVSSPDAATNVPLIIGAVVGSTSSLALLFLGGFLLWRQRVKRLAAAAGSDRTIAWEKPELHADSLPPRPLPQELDGVPLYPEMEGWGGRFAGELEGSSEPVCLELQALGERACPELATEVQERQGSVNGRGSR